MDGMLLQTAEAFGKVPAGAGEMWERLQAEKEHLGREVFADGALHLSDVEVTECEPSEESVREIEWHWCQSLSDRLRALNDAQDRLIDGGYGLCLECGQQIETRRLVADPAASLCIDCQTLTEGETFGRKL